MYSDEYFKIFSSSHQVFSKFTSFYITFILLILSFRLQVYLPDGLFLTYIDEPSGWTHIVLNYIGNNEDEGIRIYYDGTEVASGRSKSWDSRSAGDGRIVVGRKYTDIDRNYASVQVDELIFFNQKITSDEAQAIYISA